jgi:hypothetical protein
MQELDSHSSARQNCKISVSAAVIFTGNSYLQDLIENYILYFFKIRYYNDMSGF